MFAFARPCVCALTIIALARPAFADPASATVMIRVVGDIVLALGPDARVWRPSLDSGEVQLGTGSGFFLSPAGYILTNSHVVRGGRKKVTVDGQVVDLTFSVRRINVIVPSSDGAGPPQMLEAALIAEDKDADLAVLSVGGDEFSYLGLGDAGGVERGDQVSAWGYPLGDKLIVESREGSEPPPVSMSSGTVSALREGGTPGLSSTVPYLQITAPINPGNSGGPLTDRDGFVVGIVQAKLEKAEGVGFAISVDGIKQFLERVGLDSMLPVTRLSLGPSFDFGAKGLRMRVPAGFTDASASRARIDSGDSLGRVRLEVDRFATPWDLARVERVVLDGRAFGGVPRTPISDRPQAWVRDPRVKLGMADARGGEASTRMVYALVDLGVEKLIVRYTAPAEDVAFNLSALRDSIASMEVASLIPRPLAVAMDTRLVPLSGSLGLSAPLASVPARTVVEAATPSLCEGAPPPAGSLVASVDTDFTVRFVATWWPRGAGERAIEDACLGRDEDRRLQARVQQFGIGWASERRVIQRPRGEIVLLELWAPETKIVFAQPAFRAWQEGNALQKP